MSLKKFQDIQVGTAFVYNGIEYHKIPDERVSCCKINNACMVTDKSKKTHIIPITEVEVND